MDATVTVPFFAWRKPSDPMLNDFDCTVRFLTVVCISYMVVVVVVVVVPRRTVSAYAPADLRQVPKAAETNVEV